MKLKIYHIDAFTDQLFKGNPASVIPLENWLSEELMQKIAFENNQPETAFYVKESENFHIRWFTPLYEVDLCGHATIASAFVLFNFQNYNQEEIIFNSRSGILKVSKKENLFTLDFPSVGREKVEAPNGMIIGLGSSVPLEVYKVNDDYMAVFESEKEVENIKPDFAILKKLEGRGIIITAKGENVDFVSRFFTPKFGINEDPVTGSTHTKLIPFWAEILGKNELIAKQISARGGDLWCKLEGDRVKISGHAKLYMSGEIEIYE